MKIVNIGDIVVIEAEYPIGLVDAKFRSKGGIGVVTDTGTTDACIKYIYGNYKSEFWFYMNDVRPAKDEEIKKAFIKEMMK